MTLDLDDLERKAKAATPGNWHTVDRIWLPRDGMTYVIAGHHDPHIGAFVCDVGVIEEWDDENTYEKQAAQKEADAKFIAAANPAAVLELVARLRAAEDEVRQLRSGTLELQADVRIKANGYRVFVEDGAVLMIDGKAERLRAAEGIVRRLAHVEIRDADGRCIYCLTEDEDHFTGCLYRSAVELQRQR